MFRAELVTPRATLQVRGKWEFICPANWFAIDPEIQSGRIFDAENEEVLSVITTVTAVKVTVESLLEACCKWISSQKSQNMSKEKMMEFKDVLLKIISPEFVAELQSGQFDPKHWFEDKEQRKVVSTMLATIMTFSGLGLVLSSFKNHKAENRKAGEVEDRKTDEVEDRKTSEAEKDEDRKTSDVEDRKTGEAAE